MAASRKKTIKKVSKKITHNKSLKSQRGRISEKLILLVVAIVLLLGVGVWFFKPWQYFSRAFIDNSSPVVVTKPTMDMARARQMTIYPDKDNVMQVTTKEKVLVTLEVPKGGVKEKTLVQLIPFYHDEKSKAPTSGVVVGPASINFAVPVTLSFNFSDSKYKNQAPKTALEQKIRTTGLSQVMQIDSKATSLTPTLIARGIETERYLPARILTGGAYVFSLDGSHQIQNARKALDADGMHTLIVMESATTLLFNNQKLTDIEMKKTKAAVGKILSKKTPSVFEYYAALVLQKKIKTPSFSFSLIPKAFAYATDEGFFQVVCKEDKYTVEEYLGFAGAAELYGHDAVAKSCRDKAKNKVAEETKKILAGNPDFKTLAVALADVQLLGLDDDTNLDEQLREKQKEVATENAKKVADDPNSKMIDKVKAMEDMQKYGADNGPTYNKLEQDVSDFVAGKEAEADKASEEYQKGEAAREAEIEKMTKEAEAEEERLQKDVAENSIDEEEILVNQAWSQLGIGLLQAFGFEELDKESLKKKFDEMQEQAKGVVEGGVAWCQEMRAEGIDPGDCEEQMRHAEDLLKQAEDMSYRLENDIGNIQSREYEEPDYLQNNGEYSIYFEEDLTPTPEDGEGSDVGEYSQEDYQDEPGTDESQVEDGSNYDGMQNSINSSSTEEDSGEDSGMSVSESDSEDVHGTSTWKFKQPSWWPF